MMSQPIPQNLILIFKAPTLPSNLVLTSNSGTLTTFEALPRGAFIAGSGSAPVAPGAVSFLQLQGASGFRVQGLGFGV